MAGNMTFDKEVLLIITIKKENRYLTFTFYADYTYSVTDERGVFHVTNSQWKIEGDWLLFNHRNYPSADWTAFDDGENGEGVDVKDTINRLTAELTIRNFFAQ